MISILVDTDLLGNINRKNFIVAIEPILNPKLTLEIMQGLNQCKERKCVIQADLKRSYI